jgi:hypothetical protein
MALQSHGPGQQHQAFCGPTCRVNTQLTVCSNMGCRGMACCRAAACDCRTEWLWKGEERGSIAPGKLVGDERVGRGQEYYTGLHLVMSWATQICALELVA